jgi:hypothetical protein
LPSWTEPLPSPFASNIAWTAPGDNRIAGTHRGLDEALDYLRRRRDLADRAFKIKRRDVLVGDGTIWGGELLVGDLRGFERVGRLRPAPLPGGAAAIGEPARWPAPG